MTIHPGLVAAVAVVLAAGLGLLGVLYSQLLTRVGRLEDQVAKSRRHNRALWEWCRNALDLYLRHRKDGAPDLPPIPTEDD